VFGELSGGRGPEELEAWDWSLAVLPMALGATSGGSYSELLLAGTVTPTRCESVVLSRVHQTSARKTGISSTACPPSAEATRQPSCSRARKDRVPDEPTLGSETISACAADANGPWSSRRVVVFSSVM